MAHENKHEVLHGHHVYEKGEYVKKEYTPQDFPKWVDGVLLKDAKEERAYFEKKKADAKKAKEAEEVAKNEKVPVVTG